MRLLNWIVALCGLWEFGDTAALFYPGFGRVQPFLWNHIIAGLVLMVAGAWAARTNGVSVSRTLNWIAACAGAWLVASSSLLRYPTNGVGLWNDAIVGAIVLAVDAWLLAGRSQ